MSGVTQCSATPTLTLTFAQIMNLQHSPGVQAIRLGPMDISRNFLIDTSLVFKAGSPAPFHPLSKSKNKIHNKDNYIPIFEKMGPIPSLEELTLDLGTPSTELYPLYPVFKIQQGSESSSRSMNRHTAEIPFWYSIGIAQAIHALVGKNSNIRSLTLTGFHAYKSPNISDVSDNIGSGRSEYDLLAHLLDPVYFPRLEHLHLAGFSPSSSSAFWSTIRLNEDGLESPIAERKLPLRSLAFTMKVCRGDLLPTTLHADILDGVGAISKLLRTPSSHLNNPFKASIHLDDGTYYTLFNARDDVELFTSQNHVSTSDSDSQPTQVSRW